jgi:CheY-like chemotaxis protein
MHFNRPLKNKGLGPRESPHVARYDDDRDNRLIAIDTITIDERSRLLLTQKIRGIFPVLSGDVVAVYQDSTSREELIFKIQRRGIVVDCWKIKREEIGDYDIKKLFDSAFFEACRRGRLYSADSSLVQQGTTTTTVQRHRISNIMIVDDHPDMVLTYKSFLSDEEYSIDSFTDSHEVIKHFAQMDPSYYDLAIMDIRMPGINGLQLFQILKSINKDLKVLFISALDAAEELTSILPGICIDDVIRKPIRKDQFIGKVNTLLNKTYG